MPSSMNIANEQVIKMFSNTQKEQSVNSSLFGGTPKTQKMERKVTHDNRHKKKKGNAMRVS
jgi:hypothetical protein